MDIALEPDPPQKRRCSTCHACIDACAWNRFAVAAPSDEVRARPFLLATPLVAWLALDEKAFARTSEGAAILRTGRDGFLRNVCAALGNRGLAEDVPALVRALADPSELVRAHAAWALGRIGGETARAALAAALSRESDADARGEMASALPDGRV